MAGPTEVEREQQAAPESRGFLREHPIKAVLGLIVLIGAGIGVFMWWSYTQTFEETDDAQIDGAQYSVSARIAGTVTAVNFSENQQVQAGQVLVEIDPRDVQVRLEQAQANLLQAQAQIRAAQPAIPITSTTTETSIAAAQASIANANAGIAAAERDYEAQRARIAQAEANNVRAQADLARYAQLIKKDEVSREDYDQRVAAARAAQAALESAQASAAAAQRIIDQRGAVLQQAQTQLDQATRTAPLELTAQRSALELRRASANVAKTAVSEAELNLSYTKILAPVTGLVGRKGVDIGQRIQPGQQLAAIVPLKDIWVTANFKENQLRHMRVGQRATIHVDAYDKDYEGSIESMPPATSARFSVLPPENASGNYVKVVQRLPVRIRFKNGQDENNSLRPGMSVVPKVWLK